jgi:hypothetical protein
MLSPDKSWQRTRSVGSMRNTITLRYDIVAVS